MTEAEFLVAEFRQIIEMECPSDEECEEAGGDENACFVKHPIHYSSMRNGRIMSILAELDGAAPLYWRRRCDSAVSTSRTFTVSTARPRSCACWPTRWRRARMPDAESATVELRDKLKWILDNTPGVLLYDALLAHTANAVIEAYVKGYEKGHIDSHEEGGSG